VPAGGLPYDVKVLVLNVGTVCFLEEFLRTGMPLVRKNLTLDGDALVKPCNMNVPVGALISDIIEASGGLKEEPSKVMMGGPMMGIALDRLDIGIVKANNAILVMDSRQAYTPPENPCIRCSRCIDACPMMLLPTTLDALTKIKDVSALRDHNVMDCIECGCCSYVCPSKRYLVQSIRWGKLLVKNASTKN
jgi:electron transport complex protein RnfC